MNNSCSEFALSFCIRNLNVKCSVDSISSSKHLYSNKQDVCTGFMDKARLPCLEGTQSLLRNHCFPEKCRQVKWLQKQTCRRR